MPSFSASRLHKIQFQKGNFQKKLFQPDKYQKFLFKKLTFKNCFKLLTRAIQALNKVFIFTPLVVIFKLVDTGSHSASQGGDTVLATAKLQEKANAIGFTLAKSLNINFDKIDTTLFLVLETIILTPRPNRSKIDLEKNGKYLIFLQLLKTSLIFFVYFCSSRISVIIFTQILF